MESDDRRQSRGLPFFAMSQAAGVTSFPCWVTVQIDVVLRSETCPDSDAVDSVQPLMDRQDAGPTVA